MPHLNFTNELKTYIEGNWLTEITVQDPIAIKWKNLDLNPGPSGCKVHALSNEVL